MSKGCPRVYFRVHDGTKNAHKLIHPVTISMDDYIMLRYQKHIGDKKTMADDIKKNSLGNQKFPIDEVSMEIAAGGSMLCYQIDSIIENGGNPYRSLDSNQDNDDDDDDIDMIEDIKNRKDI